MLIKFDEYHFRDLLFSLRKAFRFSCILQSLPIDSSLHANVSSGDRFKLNVSPFFVKCRLN